MEQRAGGILLPVSALPGPYGIGTLGREALEFVDFLSSAGQKYWQILPLVPAGDGNSPYMSPSSFAGNPLLLDLEELAREGLLTAEELKSASSPSLDRVDYAFVCQIRPALLHKAWERGRDKYAEPLLEFLDQEADWLPDYALFMALHDHYGGLPLAQWPSEIRARSTVSMVKYGGLLADESAYHAFVQLLFFRQWERVKQYANDRGISIIGDLPIYVSADSAEVWARPELFQLDEDFVPSAVAGVPPDAFTADGQHWGNPLYAWERHRASGYQWWRRRGAHMARLYDVVRIDHFRAFHTYWSIPREAKTAMEGHWEPGPGMELVEVLRNVPGLSLIAEDLGDLDDSARAFIARSGLPGMKVLVYAFDPIGESAYLPHNCPPNSVCYTGTHDTPTFVQWLFSEASEEGRDYALDYLRLREDEGFGWGAVRGAWSSPSRLAIAPMQDLLGLGADARMNAPGTTGDQNWSWRVRSAALNGDVAGQLRHLTRIYRRGI